jgi:hypothetical protein
MKPNGVSVHVFPGPGTLVEPHLFIPITPLAKRDWWLWLWAMVRRRHRATWHGEYQFLRENMKSNNYPWRSRLEAFAKAAGVTLAFREDLYIEASRGRPWRILRRAPFLAPIVKRICQRTMIIECPIDI